MAHEISDILQSGPVVKQLLQKGQKEFNLTLAGSFKAYRDTLEMVRLLEKNDNFTYRFNPTFKLVEKLFDGYAQITFEDKSPEMATVELFYDNGHPQVRSVDTIQ